MTVVDDYSWECLTIEAGLSMMGAYVAEVIERLVEFKGGNPALTLPSGRGLW